MEEKILVKSEKMNTTHFLIKWWAIASVVVFAVALFITINDYVNGSYSYGYSRYDLGEPFFVSEVFPLLFIAPLFFGGVLTIPAIIIYFEYKKMELVVTDKRVYGFAAFGKSVDLPMDSLSAISTSIFRGIGIATSSGRIKFAFIKNRDEIQKVLREQLIIRQDIKRTQDEQNFSKTNNIEDLKQYKELLDTGVITQDEFDKKKKELL